MEYKTDERKKKDPLLIKLACSTTNATGWWKSFKLGDQ